MATHSSIVAWEYSMDRGAWQATVHKVTKSQTWLSNEHTHTKAKLGQMSRDDCKSKSSMKSTLVHLIIISTWFSEARFPDLYRDHESEKWDLILRIKKCWGLESVRYQSVNWAQRVAVGSQERKMKKWGRQTHAGRKFLCLPPYLC